MSVTLFPYTELQGAVHLSVTAVRLDGRQMPWQTIDLDSLVVELRNPDEHQWAVAEIDIEVAGPAAELQARAGELGHVRAVAVLNCGSTNSRYAMDLEHEANRAVWTGSLELDRGDWYGTASLAATIVATVEDVDHRQAGFAHAWTIRFDDLPPREISNAMRVIWEDFSDPGSDNRASLTEFADDICFLRIDPAEPILFLNQGFGGLRSLLEEKPGRPLEHRVLRTQVLTDIAVATWHALFTAAIETIEVDDDGLLGLPPEEWQRNVLNALLPRLYPNSAPDDARRDAWEARRDPTAAAALQERLMPAVSQQVLQPKALRAAISAFDKVDREEQ